MRAKYCNLVVLVLTVMIGLGTTSAATATCQASLTESLEKVGETTLRVMFFRVYDAELWTDTGSYPPDQEWLLQLTYKRDITADQLVEQTAEEWQELGYELTEEREQWLAELSAMWPDVSDGDCLLAHAASPTETVFYNAGGALGRIESEAFTEAFFAIWLSPDSSFPRNRDQLTGER